MYRGFSKFQFWSVGVFIFSITLFTKRFGKFFSFKACPTFSVSSSLSSVEKLPGFVDKRAYDAIFMITWII